MRTLKRTLLVLSLFAPSAALADDNAAAEAAPAEAAPAAAPEAAGAAATSLSLPPSAPTHGDSLVPTTAAEMGLGGGSEGSTEDWHFEFHGYMRAPMRLGIGKNVDKQPGQSDLQFHAPPLVPDWNYINWEYTNNMSGPWTELNFSYGNSRAKMTAQVASYNITDGSWRWLQANLGINQAFLTLAFPDAIPNGRLNWNVGVFSNRYGWAGRYDAGKYDTYLFGRTHTAGETLTGSYDLNGELTLEVEHGIGANLEVMPWHQNILGSNKNNGNPQYLPYGGPVPQGTTLIHHAHVGMAWKKMLIGGLHYMSAWNQDSIRVAGYMEPQAWGQVIPNGKDASLSIFGLELKFLGGAFGDGYIGYAHLAAKNINSLADNSIETIHSFGGWQLGANYFNPPGAPNGESNTNYYETGNIDSVLFQYVFSFGQLFRYPKQFWGDGPDLIASVFGMFNSVSGVKDVAGADAPAGVKSVKKLKFGADVVYLPLPWIGGGARVDVVQPDMDNAKRSFQVLSPFVVFKTAFVTHEQVTLKWSHYFYGDAVTLPYPWFIDDVRRNYGTSENRNPAGAGLVKKDADAITLAATMWW